MHKRNNQYGDEPISILTPSSKGYDAGALPEEAPAAIPTSRIPAPSLPPVESSGYRKKRNNQYGDEPAPPTEVIKPGGYEEQAEEAPAPIEQPAYEPPAVESSGYRA